MESQSDQSPLIVIVGETASGKTALALELARRFKGEIIAADSRTVYKGLDIGTAKPTTSERSQIRHHLIDVATPDQTFTVSQFKEAALQAISDVAGRQHLPLLVGGTGLYIDAVIYDFSFRSGTVDYAERQKLQQLGAEELQQMLQEQGIALPRNDRNPRHLIRSLETNGAMGSSKPLRERTLLIGLQVDREVLRQKIIARVDAMVQQGFVQEVKRAMSAYGWEVPALQAPGYKAFRRYIEREVSLEAAKELFVRADLQLAKRQRTWFKRNKSIHWIGSEEEAVDLVTTFLNKSSIVSGQSLLQ